MNGSHIAIQLTTKCFFDKGNANVMSAHKKNVVMEQISINQLSFDLISQIEHFPMSSQSLSTRSAQLQNRHSFELSSHAPHSQREQCTVNLFFLNQTEFERYVIGKLSISTLLNKENFFNISHLNLTVRINRRIDYILIESKRNFPLEVVYKFQYYPIPSDKGTSNMFSLHYETD
jgi:hypothetical protein